MDDKTKILIISANPWDIKGRISPEEEYGEIEKIRAASKERDNFEVKYTPAASDAELRQVLLDFEPQIVHFSGHGELDGLCFQNADGNTQFISKEALIRLFSLFAKQIKCVVLNACYSAEQAEAIAQHINFVVGMSKAIGDEAAIKFATGFYQALFNGRDIEFSFDFGCSAIDLNGIPEWQTPQLKKKQNSELHSQQTPHSFLPDYHYDVLIHVASSEKSWAEDFADELQKHLTQNLHNESCRIQLQSDNADFEKAATLLLILSPDYLIEHQKTLAQLEKHIEQKRLFLARHSAVKMPAVLQRCSLSYVFWKPHPQLDFCTIDKNDQEYFLQIRNIANDITNRLTSLKEQQQVKQEFQQIKQTIGGFAKNDIVFVNVDSENLDLTDKIKNSLQENKVGYAFLADEDDPGKLSTDLENKLLQCDAVLLIYEHGDQSWIDFQLLLCGRTLRKRKEPFKIVAVYTEKDKSKINVYLPNLNLQIFYCQPEQIENYLPLFIKELK